MSGVNNDIQIEAYSTGTMRITDPDAFELAQAVNHQTFWPMGLYGSASLYIPRDILRWWAINGAQRIVFRNGQEIVYEGKIDKLSDLVDESGEGKLVGITGFSGDRLMRVSLRRWYVDTRTGADVWRVLTAAGVDEICDVRRQDDNGADCLTFQPRRDAWAANQHYDLTYTCPTGETIKRIEYDWSLASVNNEDWTIRIYDVTNATELAALSRTTTGASSQTSQTLTLSPTSSKIQIQWESDAAQTPAVDGADNKTSRAKVVNLRVFAETNNTGNYANNIDEIAKDLVVEFSTLFNSDVTNIDTPGTPYALTVFTPDWDTLADILTNAASFGDGATPPNLWGCYLLDSEKAATPNGLPVLAVKQALALTSYDYGVHLSAANVVAPVSITRDYSQIQNWIIVEYQTADGRTEYITPADDATLTDATSVAAYGQLNSPVLNFGTANPTTAAQLGRRHLAKWKDPVYVLDGPIQVQSYILDSNNQPVPACRVQAGKRIRILDYLDDLSGTGLTLHVSATDYDAETETCSIMTGPLDELAVGIGQANAYTPPGLLPPHVDPIRGRKKKRRKKKKRRGISGASGSMAGSGTGTPLEAI